MTTALTLRSKWLGIAMWLSIFTIVYNFAEGLVSVYFGSGDDTLALLGFGIDSYVEVISGIGIAHMIFRMYKSDVEKRDTFERQALRITGMSFYLLVAGLLAGVVFALIDGRTPSSSLPGSIIGGISIVSMYFLMKAKLKAGKILQSDAIISDAHCTRTCLYLSAILLASSLLRAYPGIPYVDLAGSLGIAWFAFTEGREAFEKASSESMACSHCNCEKAHS